MRFLIKLVKASAVSQTYLLSNTHHKNHGLDDIINPDFEDDLDEDLYLLPTLIGSDGHSEGTPREEEHNFLNAMLSIKTVSLLGTVFGPLGLMSPDYHL